MGQNLHDNMEDFCRTSHINYVIYCILRGWIKGFNNAIYAIKCQQVVIELWLGSYSTVVG